MAVDFHLPVVEADLCSRRASGQVSIQRLWIQATFHSIHFKLRCQIACKLSARLERLDK